MKTLLRKLFGASVGTVAAGGFFVLGLTGLITVFPCVGHAAREDWVGWRKVEPMVVSSAQLHYSSAQPLVEVGGSFAVGGSVTLNGDAAFTDGAWGVAQGITFWNGSESAQIQAAILLSKEAGKEPCFCLAAGDASLGAAPAAQGENVPARAGQTYALLMEYDAETDTLAASVDGKDLGQCKGLGASGLQVREALWGAQSGGDARLTSVTGDFAFVGDETVSEAPTAQALAATPARYLRVTFTRWIPTTSGDSGGNGVAIAEFRVLSGGTDVTPSGTTVSGVGSTDSLPKLLNGTWNNADKWWVRNDQTGEQSSFTYDFGSAIAFDSYLMGMADVSYRNPIAWKVELSQDGKEWKLWDVRDLGSVAAARAVAAYSRLWYGPNAAAAGAPSAERVAWRYLRYTSLRDNGINYPAFGEMRLLLGGCDVTPQTVTVTGSSTNSNCGWGNLFNHNVCYFGSNQKAWASSAKATFTADLGRAVAFDGYSVELADHGPRNPIAWKVEVSNDNAAWTVFDLQDFGDIAGASAFWGAGSTTSTNAHDADTGMYPVRSFSTRLYDRPALTGRSVSFALGACGSLGADLTGETLYGIAPYQVKGSGWNNLAPESTAKGGNLTVDTVRDNAGNTVDGAAFSVSAHGEVVSVTTSDTARTDTSTTSEYCLLPSGGNKMAVFKENPDGEDSFVFTGVPYKKFSVVLYLGQGGVTADGHDYVTVTRTYFNGMNSSGSDKTYSTKYTYKDGRLTIVDGEKIKDGTHNVGIWGNPEINWSNDVGDGVMVLPNQEADKNGAYTFRLSQKNNNGGGASWRSMFRAVSFVEQADTWHEPLDERRGSVGFVLGKISSSKGVDPSPTGWYGLNGYALPGSAWNLLGVQRNQTVAVARDRFGETVEGLSLAITSAGSANADLNMNNVRVLPPFEPGTPTFQSNATFALTGIPYKRYTAILYLNKDQGWHSGKDIRQVTVTADGETKDYTYVNGLLTEGSGAWGAYTQAGIVGLEGVGAMVLRGLTAADIAFKTNGGDYNSQLQGIQIVEETEIDRVGCDGVRMLHRFDFEDTMAVGGKTRLAPVDKGAGGHAFPVVTDDGSNDTLPGEARFGAHGMTSSRGTSELSNNSDGFRLRNVMGLGCGADTGFTLSAFLKNVESADGKGPLSITLGKVGEPDSKSFTVQFQKWGSSPAFTLGGFWAGNSAELSATWKTETQAPAFPVGEWGHYAVVVRPAAASFPKNGEANGEPCVTLDFFYNGRRCGTCAFDGLRGNNAVTMDGMVLKEVIVGRSRRSTTPSDANNNLHPTNEENPKTVYLDEVALFDRPLSDEGIAWLSEHEAAVPPVETAQTEWSAIPTAHSGVSQGNWANFRVCFGGSGVRHMGAQVPTVTPETAALRGATVRWTATNAANVSVRKLALVDSRGKVAALSGLIQTFVPADGHCSAYFPFPEGTVVDFAENYKGYFIGDRALEIGSDFNASFGIKARYLTFAGATAEGGFHVEGNTGHAPHIAFAFYREPVGSIVVDGASINVCFGPADRLEEGGEYGLVPFLGSAWNTVAAIPDSPVTVTDSAGTAGIGVTATARGMEDLGEAYHPLLRDFLLDDGNNADSVSVTLTGIPYETYDAYVYMTANEWPRNGPVFVNGDTSAYYHMPEGAEAAVAAPAPTAWGKTGEVDLPAQAMPELGVNAMRIANLSGGDLTLTAHRFTGARGNICAVQIVERKEVEPAAWHGTVGVVAESATLTVVSEDGKRTAQLADLTSADRVTLTVDTAAALTVSRPQTLAALTVEGLGTLTLRGRTLTVGEATGVTSGALIVEGGCLRGEVNVSSGAVLGFSGAETQTFAGRVTGQGSVRVTAGADVSLTNPENDWRGGAEVQGTLRWGGAGTLGDGLVVVRAGGVFDLNGFPCAHPLELDGGTLANAVAPKEAFLVSGVNFNAGTAGSAFRLGDTAVGGLLPMAGRWWSNQTSASGTASFDALPITLAGTAAETTTRVFTDAISWSATQWAPNNHTVPFMNGYLDDGGGKWAELAIPGDLAATGYDVYLYANTDTAGAFAARDVTGDDGAAIPYTYVDGVLTAGNTAGWGSTGERSALAVGTNVMVLPGRTDRSLRMTLPNRNGRGCLAAIQVGFRRAAYTGALTVRSASALRGTEGAPLDLWGAAVSGEGDLTAEGGVTVSASALGARKLAVPSGTLTLGPGNDLSSAQLGIGAGATVSAQAGVTELGLAGVTGAGTLNLGGVAELTFTGVYGNAAHTGAVTGGAEGLTVTKRGATSQTFSAFPEGARIAVEAGTLELTDAARAGALTLAGGTFSATGAFSADYAEMARGAVALASAGTAAEAKPAMAAENDATVSRFTLAEGGAVRYDTKADFAKHFPKGFIPYRETPYKIRLGTDLADELTFPVTFVVQGADASARFEVLGADGLPAPEGSWGANGNVITLNDVGAVVGDVSVLPQPKYHWAFDGNLDLAEDSRLRDVEFTGEGVGADSYETSENGRALIAGTPYASPVFGDGNWTLTAYVSLRGMASGATLLSLGRADSAGALAIVRGTGNAFALMHKPTSAWARLLEAPVMGADDSWHFVALTRSPKNLTLYVDGVLAGRVAFEGVVADANLQIGKGFGGGDPSLPWTASPGAADDLAIYDSVLREAQLAQALAKSARNWRWHAASAPEALFDPAAADWADAVGVLGPFDPNDGTLTARVSLLDAATLDALCGGAAAKGLRAGEIYLSGEAVAHRLPADLSPATLPEGARRLFADNALTLDLGDAEALLTARWLSGGGDVKVADGRWLGPVTLRNAPEGAMVSAVAEEDGIYLNGYMDGARDWDWAVALDLKWDGLEAGSLYGPEGYRLEGAKWNSTPGTGTSAGVTVSNLRTSAGETLSGSAVNVQTKGNITYGLRPGFWDKMLKGVAEGPARYTFSNLPAGNYELLVYFSWENAGTCSPIKTIDGGGAYYYAYGADGSLLRVAAAEGTEVPAGWGQINYDDKATTRLGCAIGKNTIKVPVSVGADGALVVEVSDSVNPAQGPGLDWQAASGRGMTAGIGLYHLSDETPPVYVRTVAGEGAWSEAGAWSLPDGTVAPEPEPPEGAVVVVTVEADAVLTVARDGVRLNGLRVFGEGALALRYDASAWMGQEDYEAIPASGKEVMLLEASCDPDRVRVWLDGLRYGAFADVSQTASGATAHLSLPEALYPERGLISVNFWDFMGAQSANKYGRLTGDGTSGMEGYNACVAYWAQPDEDSGTGKTRTLTLKSVPFAQREAQDAPVTELPDALTYSIWNSYGFSQTNKGLLKGFLNDRPVDQNYSTGGPNSNLSVKVPEGWSRYTAIVYGSVNNPGNNQSWPTFTPRRVNGVWYTYADGALTPMEGVDGVTPAFGEGAWGDTSLSYSSASSFVEGGNVMVVPGLRGDFTLEWYSDAFLSGHSMADCSRGGVAAIQLVQDAAADLSRANTFYARVSGDVSWGDVAWLDAEGNPREGTPGAGDTVALTLTADASLSCVSGAGGAETPAPFAVASLQVYGNGHAVAFHDRDALTVGEWAFLNDTTLALAAADETLPEGNVRAAPRRVRYDYAREGAFTSTETHETEFAAGFSGAFTPGGGLTEFSGGRVAFSSMGANATHTRVIFSGDARVTVADGAFTFNHADVTLRGKAAVVSERMVLTNSSATPRITNLTLEDDASITVTGDNNDMGGTGNQASLLMAHWSGNATVTLRGRSSLVAEKAELVLVHGEEAGLTERLILEDEATVRVAGLSTHNTAAATVEVTLNGGRLLVGSRGLRTESASRPFSLTFAGGAFGAWQDVTLGADAAAALTAVSGDPVFASEGEAELTLTQPAPFADDLSKRLVFRAGKVRLAGSAFVALPALETAGGTLTLACSATTPRLRLHGGRLHLEGGFPVADAIVSDASTVVRVPLVERLSEGGYLAVARNGLLPGFGQTVFELALAPNRPASESVLPMVPLALGSYAEGASPDVAGLSVLNNANGALSDWEAVLANGDAGSGLYVRLSGNEVLRQYTAELHPDKVYDLPQSTANGWPFVVFRGHGPDSLLRLPEQGLALPHATFAGSGPIRVTARGDAPHVVLRGVGYTFSTDVVFDLSAWKGALDDLLRGAVRGVPASVCLVSGGVVKAPASVLLTVDWGTDAEGNPIALPSGFSGTVEATADGVYYVVRADRRTRTVSANFTSAAVPLAAPPSVPGAYGVPVAAWNDLASVFSSSSLRISDAGGGFGVPARSEAGLVTQLLAYGAQAGSDPAAPTPMLRAWVSDSAAQSVRLTNVPFARWRLALVFSNDLGGAAWSAVTVNGHRYAMDAEGYVRRDVLPYGDAIPGDEQWGTTDRAEASAPTVLGRNVLVTDVLSGDVTLELPAFVYGRRYAGLAALQLLEAPAPTAVSEPLDFSHAFAGDGAFALADLDLTVGGGIGKWADGPENTLTLTCDHDVALTLPEGFEAARITCVGAGHLTLLPARANAGVAVGALNAARLAEVTVGFPLLGVPFSPAQGVSRFERPFDNAGEPYLIARGATLALGADSGVSTQYDGSASPLLTVAAGSAGTLRRDYPVTQTSTVKAPGLTFAFGDADITLATDNSNYGWLVEEGDNIRHSGKYHLDTNAGAWSYAQTGGDVVFGDSSAADGGMLLFNNNSAKGSAEISVSGGRLETFMVSSWKSGSLVDIRVSDEGTLALGAGGLRANAADAALHFALSGRGTLEAIGASLPKAGSGAVRANLEGGRLTTSRPEVAVTLPLTFAAGPDAPTEVAPAALSTLVLSAANAGSGALAVTRGTLAVNHAQGLGAATVAVRSGAAFEARGFGGAAAASGTVRFEAGAACSATTPAAPTLPYTARIASAIAFPDGKETVAFLLNGDLYDGSKVTVDEAAGVVTFDEAAKIVGEAVVWATDAAEGVWRHGEAGPWQEGKTFLNGAEVTFGAVLEGATERAQVTVGGTVRPGTLTFDDGAVGKYAFLQGAEGAHIDASALGSALHLGAGLTFDAPILTDTVGVTLSGPETTARLIGVPASGDGKTVSLVGSGNVGGANQGTHGVWHTADMGDMVWSPHAGETQRLSPFGTHFGGEGNIIVTGQTAPDGSVSGGTVAFAGHTAGTNWNAVWSGAFKVRDGATLDFAMTREDTGDKDPYFRAGGAPLWENGAVGVELTHGATLRFSECRGILGGENQGARAALVESQPIVIGKDCRAEYLYDYNHSVSGYQFTPHGFRLNGDGATLYVGDGADTGKGEAYRGLFLARGASIVVAGVGDPGDLSDPKVDTAADPETGDPVNPETYGRLTEGITAYIDASAGTGLVRWNTGIGTVGDTGVRFVVGTNSVLRIRAGLDSGANRRSADTAFVKAGAGRLLVETPSVAVKTPIRVEEGTLGGIAEFTNADTVVTVADGAGIEAGLSLPVLSFGREATLFLDPTGSGLLCAGRALFASGGRYRVETLPGVGEIPDAAGLAPIKIMAWESAALAGSAIFVPGEALRAKGYGLEVRDDGLYAMRRAVYVRRVAEADAERPSAYSLAWHAEDAWFREEAPDVPRDYDPSDSEAVTVCFVVPDAWVSDGTTVPMTLLLSRAVSFASVRFVAESDFAANGAMGATPLLLSAVYYNYDLSQEAMPGEGETRSFTWVPSLVVETPSDSSARSLAYVTVSDLPGYTASVSERTVVVYTAAAAPALNVNFTGKSTGDPSWIDSDTEPCGARPFAGVYWNNASPVDLISTDGAHSAFALRATLFGVEADAEGRAPTAEVTYVSRDPRSVASRRGSGDAGLAAGFLPGETGVLPANLLTAAGMDAAFSVNGGWRVRVDSVPFDSYDLYLLMAGAADGAVTYSPVYVKVGNGNWVAYGNAGGWSTVVWRNDLWKGRGGPEKDGFAVGANLIHLRLQASAGASVEIQTVDYGNGDAANVGLAAFQIVRCDDGAALSRVGAGKWSDALGWQRQTPEGTVTGAWEDATDAKPRPAVLPTVSSLTADRAAVAPYVRMTGSATLSGAAGALSVPSLDLSAMPANAVVSFASDPFAEPPMVHLAPEISLTLPEGGLGVTVTNAWRWVCDEKITGASPDSATIRKAGAGDLVLSRKYTGKLRIDDGTLWLSTGVDGAYARSAEIAGDGVFGKVGAGDLEIPWNSLRTTGAAGVLAQARDGVLYLNADNGSLPAGQTIEAIENGTVVFRLHSGNQRRPFNKGVIRARAGGRVILRDATNLFDEGENRPRLVLEDGMYQGDVGSGTDYHLYSLTTRGNAAIYMNANANNTWNRKALTLWDGGMTVESGDLAIWSNTHGSNNAIAFLNKSGGNGPTIREGATVYSEYPLHPSTANSNRTLLLHGGGTLVQTKRLFANSTVAGGYTPGAAELLDGTTLRWNLGADTQQGAPADYVCTFTLREGSRMDGAGRLQSSDVVVMGGATLSSGLPQGWAGIDTAHKWYASLPDRFKREPSDSIRKLRIDGNLTFRDDAILEANLANANALDVDGTVTFGKTLTVRLANLPASLAEARRLTDFAEAPVGTPKITCPEAVALGSEVVLRDGNLWLEPTFGGYVWADRAGGWSDAAWSTNDVANLAIPYARDAASETAPTARVVASAADAAIAVGKPDSPLTPEEGVFWGNRALVLSAASGRAVALTQGSADPAGKPNGLTVAASLWKIGDGTAKVGAPLRFANLANAGSLHVSAGALELGLPLSKEEADTTYTAKNHLPAAFAVEIAKGAELRFAFGGEAATEAALGFAPLEQTLAGPVTGAGTLTFAPTAAGAKLTLTGAADSDLDYDVRGGTLSLAGAVAPTARASQRVVSVASGARLELQTEGALGWTANRALRLEAAPEGKGARVETVSDARVRGRVEVTRAASAAAGEACSATLGSVHALVDGTLAFDVPADTTLEVGGRWQTPADAVSGALVKRGAGTLRILGEFAPNLPMEVAEGAVVVGAGNGGGQISAINLNAGATVADWAVAGGARVEFADTETCDLNGGTLSLAAGGELWLSAPSLLRFSSAVDFADGAVIRAGTGPLKTLVGMRIGGDVALRGTVTVNLDALDPVAFTASATQASYPILEFERAPTGAGSFVLGGGKLVAWARAGWTLRLADNQLLLESFGGDAGYYAWEGADDDVGPANWAREAWVRKGSEARVAWPDANTGDTPSALFADRGHDGTEIPAAARTVDWTLPAQTLAALRVDNDLPGSGDAEASHDYTLTAVGAVAPTLTVAGDLLKTGSAALTVRRPVALGTEGALRLLGGRVTFASSLASAGGVLTKPVTLAGGATLVFEGTSGWTLSGAIDGDGTGAIVKRYGGKEGETGVSGLLTLASDLASVGALTVEDGTLALAAPDAFALGPRVSLGPAAMLSQAGAFTVAGAVAMRVNEPAAAPRGVFQWAASAAADSARAPRLAAPADGLGAPAVNVAELRYAPVAGHLTLDPGHDVLPASATLTLGGEGESKAFWMGALAEGDGAAFDYAGLSGSGILGVEPVIDPFSDPVWSTNRVLTLRLAPVAEGKAPTFRGTLMGALTANGTAIRAGLALREAGGVAPGAGQAARFALAGASTDAYLGALDVGPRVRAEVNGVWAGDVMVSDEGGILGGSGTVGALGRSVVIPAGAAITASAYGTRQTGPGATRPETVPTTLSVAGTLRMDVGSTLRVLVRKNLVDNNKPWVSCVEADALVLPSVVEGGTSGEVRLNIELDIEPGAYASDVKILGWDSFSGARLTGTITINGGENTEGYTLRQKSDGLYLRRSNARFWMMFR